MHFSQLYVILKIRKIFEKGCTTMSQEKVNRYKEAKANRKEVMAKEKRQGMLVKVASGVVALALVCWLGYSIYNSATRPDTTPVQLDATAMQEYLEEMYAVEEAE